MRLRSASLSLLTPWPSVGRLSMVAAALRSQLSGCRHPPLRLGIMLQLQSAFGV
jgi:hypothetical protein